MIEYHRGGVYVKKRMFALILALTAMLCVPAAAWEPENLVLGSGTDIAMLDLIANAGANYIRGNGSNHSPSHSYLYANEKGGVTLVQYTGKTTGVAVAEFDSQLNFQKWYKHITLQLLQRFLYFLLQQIQNAGDILRHSIANDHCIHLF